MDGFGLLPDAQLREVVALAERYGIPRIDVVDLGANRFASPGAQHGRPGEVCMVIRRAPARVLIFRKTFYPAGIYRLPTGGIGEGEGIWAALERELYEETGLGVGTARFLSIVGYRTAAGGEDPVTFTHTFLLDETVGVPVPVDADERVEEFKEAAVDDLPSIADQLDGLRPQPAPDLASDWEDWGRFRAVIHRIVWEQLRER